MHICRFSQTVLLLLLLLSAQAYNKQHLSHPGVFRHLRAVTPLLPHTPTVSLQAKPNQYVISQSLCSPRGLHPSPLLLHSTSQFTLFHAAFPLPSLLLSSSADPLFFTLQPCFWPIVCFCAMLMWKGQGGKRDKDDRRGLKV